MLSIFIIRSGILSRIPLLIFGKVSNSPCGSTVYTEEKKSCKATALSLSFYTEITFPLESFHCKSPMPIFDVQYIALLQHVVVIFFFQYNQSWTSLPSIVLSWNSVSCIKCLILWILLCYETGPFTAPCTSDSVTVGCD